MTGIGIASLADAEIAPRTLGLRAPITIRRNLDGPERIGLYPCVGHDRLLLSAP